MTEIKPWMEKNHPRLWAEWKRSKTKSDKVVVQNDARIAYGQYARLSNPETKAKHKEGQRVRYAASPEFKDAQWWRTRKSQILGWKKNSGLRNRILPILKELGSEAEVKTAQDLIDKLSPRGYQLTQADIDAYDRLSDDARKLKTSTTQKRLRPPYGVPEGELIDEVWEFEQNKKAYNQRLRQLVNEGVINEQQFKKYQLSVGHGLPYENFEKFGAEVNNIFSETVEHNRRAGTRLTGAQLVDQVKAILNERGIGVDATTRSKINDFGRLAERKGLKPDFIYTSTKTKGGGATKAFNMNELLRYFTGYGVEGEHGLEGLKKVDPLQRKVPLSDAAQKRLALGAVKKSGLMGFGKSRAGLVLKGLGLTGAALAAAIKSAQAKEEPSILDPVDDFSNVMPSKSGWFGRVAPTGSREADKYIDKRQARLDEERRPLTQNELDARRRREWVYRNLHLLNPVLSSLGPSPEWDVPYSKGGPISQGSLLGLSL